MEKEIVFVTHNTIDGSVQAMQEFAKWYEQTNK